MNCIIEKTVVEKVPIRRRESCSSEMSAERELTEVGAPFSNHSFQTKMWSTLPVKFFARRQKSFFAKTWLQSRCRATSCCEASLGSVTSS